LWRLTQNISAFKDQQSEKKRSAAEAGGAGAKKQKGWSYTIEMNIPHDIPSQAIKGDSMAEEDGGDDEEEDEERNKDGSASEEEQNDDGGNDDA
jgi:hypothetical protein